MRWPSPKDSASASPNTCGPPWARATWGSGGMAPDEVSAGLRISFRPPIATNRPTATAKLKPRLASMVVISDSGRPALATILFVMPP